MTPVDPTPVDPLYGCGGIPDHSDLVHCIWDHVHPTDQFSAFEVTKRVAWALKGEGAGLHHGGLSSMILVAGNEDHSGLRRSGAEMSEHFHSGHAFHPDIQKDYRNGMDREVREKRFRFAKDMHFETCSLSARGSAGSRNPQIERTSPKAESDP